MKKDGLYVIIPAGGSGTRFGGKKQFADLCGKPLIFRTVEGVSDAFTERKIFTNTERDGVKISHSIELKKIIVAVPSEDVGLMNEILSPFFPSVAIVEGGDTRAESVKSAYRFLASFLRQDEERGRETESEAESNAESVVESNAELYAESSAESDIESHAVSVGLSSSAVGCAYVAVHDGCRPLASAALWDSLLSALREGADFVLPYTDITDTVKRRESLVNIAREDYVAVQTPQMMRMSVAERIYSSSPRDLYPSSLRAAEDAEIPDDAARITDDATLAERCGYSITLVKGEKTNIKVTTPEDVWISQVLFRTKTPN